MSDEPAAGHSAAPTTTATPDKPADAYGQPIGAERQAELQGYLDRCQQEIDAGAGHGGRRGPFDPAGSTDEQRRRLVLTGADVSWLAEQSGRTEVGWVPNLHLEGADLHLAHLEGAKLGAAHLDGATLFGAHLEGANLFGTHLEGANLNAAQLDGANLFGTHLERANLGAAELGGATLFAAELGGASLRGAHLDGADLGTVQLEGADLTGAWLDSRTVLNDATLDTKTHLGDIQWGGVGAVNLTQIAWTAVRRLGDEQGVGIRSKVADHEAVVRAYRQLAAQLRAQGLSEVADRFLDRAQVRQRKLLFRQMLADWRRPWRLPGDLARWLFSWFLALLAGYGYHPGRSVFWYLATIAGFAFMYMQATRGWIPFGLPHPSQLAALPWYEALILSVSSFHGRGFFQPLQSLGDPVAALASIEAVIGLLIEISFIATFTQRFFGSK